MSAEDILHPGQFKEYTDDARFKGARIKAESEFTSEGGRHYGKLGKKLVDIEGPHWMNYGTRHGYGAPN